MLVVITYFKGLCLFKQVGSELKLNVIPVAMGSC